MNRAIRGCLASGMLLAAFFTTSAQAFPYSAVFVFGDSLGDSGNNAIFFDTFVSPPPGPTLRTPTPPLSMADIIPTFPYASNRYTNGPVWVEYLADDLGRSALPSFAGGTNFAHAGARTGPTGSSFPFSVLDQVSSFLAATSGSAPSNALYIVQGGGNDARDIADGITSAATGIPGYAANVASIVMQLETAGARDIIVGNIPDLGKAPAVRAGGELAAAAASGLVALMNGALAATLDGLDLLSATNVQILDLFALSNAVFADPAAFGLTDATSMCVLTAACLGGDASNYFFWDGIHPTTAGHEILAQQAMLLAIPEPETYALLLAGLALLTVVRRRATKPIRPRPASSSGLGLRLQPRRGYCG